ncbi:ATP-binding protein [Mycobacterium sp. NBC_00419]|uniref:AAA family ATPase n=1 Tax=Mycobacterium sp. NBC_00419 TaxID=2975989 RepID=UPI0032459374
MRFASLSIKNFKAIQRFQVDELSDLVLIAGPNGCGKSCVFDSIRLLKSVYGGYQANEWTQWFGEFQIDVNDREQLRKLFRDQAQPIEISATVELDQSEKEYLESNAEVIAAPLAWASVTGQPIESVHLSMLALAAQFRHLTGPAHELQQKYAEILRNSLAFDSFGLALTIAPDLQLNSLENKPMEMIFQTYQPEHLGVIEYHSASRTYQREVVSGVNLDARQLEDQRKQSTLYNSQQKYQNIKTQLATTYIRQLVAKEAGVQSAISDLNETLKELFQTFFPEKEYLGVEPDPNGGLRFPVRTKAGQVFDINELSSGEKEVLYGYLWLRNSTPYNSTILLDEPELHLNPGLLSGLPDFYHKNLGKARNNQLWLVTHSDTLLRQAVGNANYSVFHMISADAEEGFENQAVPVLAHDELERATIDLVGDLAMYRPQGKVILFEGGGDTDTDVRITERLFPTFAKNVNLVSGGSKQRVKDLYEVLAHTAEQVGMARRFFAITDKDSSPWELPPHNARYLSWDVYHIENYLLEASFVRKAIGVLIDKPRFKTDDEVLSALGDAAAEAMPELVSIRLRKFVNDKIVSSVNLGGDPRKSDAASALIDSVNATFGRLEGVRQEVDMAFLQAESATIQQGLSAALADGSWVKKFPGRSVLQRFVAKELAGRSNYEGFRNAIVHQMADAGYEPPGMRRIIDLILASDEPLAPPLTSGSSA